MEENMIDKIDMDEIFPKSRRERFLIKSKKRPDISSKINEIKDFRPNDGGLKDIAYFKNHHSKWRERLNIINLVKRHYVDHEKKIFNNFEKMILKSLNSPFLEEFPGVRDDSISQNKKVHEFYKKQNNPYDRQDIDFYFFKDPDFNHLQNASIYARFGKSKWWQHSTLSSHLGFILVNQCFYYGENRIQEFSEDTCACILERLNEIIEMLQIGPNNTQESKKLIKLKQAEQIAEKSYVKDHLPKSEKKLFLDLLCNQSEVIIRWDKDGKTPKHLTALLKVLIESEKSNNTLDWYRRRFFNIDDSKDNNFIEGFFNLNAFKSTTDSERSDHKDIFNQIRNDFKLIFSK
jgi:hypothetical protein